MKIYLLKTMILKQIKTILIKNKIKETTSKFSITFNNKFKTTGNQIIQKIKTLIH